MRTDRAYRKALSHEVALDELTPNAGHPVRSAYVIQTFVRLRRARQSNPGRQQSNCTVTVRADRRPARALRISASPA